VVAGPEVALGFPGFEFLLREGVRHAKGDPVDGSVLFPVGKVSAGDGEGVF